MKEQFTSHTLHGDVRAEPVRWVDMCVTQQVFCGDQPDKGLVVNKVTFVCISWLSHEQTTISLVASVRIVGESRSIVLDRLSGLTVLVDFFLAFPSDWSKSNNFINHIYNNPTNFAR